MNAVYWAQLAVSIVLALGAYALSRFVQHLFNEIKVSRSNERELYEKLAATREDMLRLEIDRMKRELDNLRGRAAG